MRVRFFAVNRTQQDYFNALQNHVNCSTDVCLSKSLIFPNICRFYRYRRAIDMATLIDHKILEKRNAGSWLGKGLGGFGFRLYLRVLIPWMGMRYITPLLDPRYDTIAVWNGKHLRQSIMMQLTQAVGKKTLFFENGMLPNTTVCDAKGVNADNSVPREATYFAEYTSVEEHALPTALIPRPSKKGTKESDTGAWLPEGFVFVPFQVNHDTQVTHHSPWIADMTALFELFEEMAVALPQQHFILKEHPSDTADYGALHERAAKLKNLNFANEVPTQQLIEQCECVATINSSVGIEAMLYRKAVIVLGEAFYGIEGITYPVRSASELQHCLEQEALDAHVELTRRFLHYLYSDYLIPGDWKHPDAHHFEAMNQRLECEEEITERALFMVSTSLHLYNAIVAAMSNPQWESHLFFIDQPEGGEQRYFDALQAWQASPFASVSMYATKVKGFVHKFQVRRNAFERMKTALSHLAPQRIYVGNDRRIEFAFALHIAKQIHPDCVGGYLDDGAYSYILQTSRWYQDTFVDIGVKKLLYGSWYFRPSVIAASDAVEEAFVVLPEFVHEKLATKRLRPLKMEMLLDPQVEPFTDYLIAPYDLDRQSIAALDLVFILPHESLIERYPAFKESILKSIETAAEHGLRVGLKYHPRQSNPDPLGVMALAHVAMLPNTLPFEALLPLLDGAVIVGDVSSALLMARWLRPDLRVLSLRNADDTRQEEMGNIFRHVGVQLVDVEHFQHTLKQELQL